MCSPPVRCFSAVRYSTGESHEGGHHTPRQGKTYYGLRGHPSISRDVLEDRTTHMPRCPKAKKLENTGKGNAGAAMKDGICIHVC